MLRNFFERWSLLSRFTLISFCVASLIVAAVAWGLERNLKAEILQEVAEDTAEQASNILDENLTAADLNDSLPPERYNEVDALLRNTLLSSNIVRIKIWNRNGLLIYSDDQSLAGQTFALSPALEAALGGRLTTEISSLEETENVAEREHFEELFEIYVSGCL